MPNEYLPLRVDPIRYADNAVQLHGYLPLKRMERLLSSLASIDGDVDVQLNFGVNEQDIRFLKGHIEGSLVLQCQRCLGNLSYDVNEDFLLGIVKTEEQAKELPGRFDPLIIKEPELFLSDVVEDELIVGLPIVPMHIPKDCKVTLPLIVEAGVMSKEQENPFKVIELLRQKRDKK